MAHDWTIWQIIERLAWWVRSCGDDCPAAEAMEQAARVLEALSGAETVNDNKRGRN